MARKRSVFFHAIQSILKCEFLHAYRQKITLFILALLTLCLTLIYPAIILNRATAIESKLQPAELEQQAKEYYDIGRFTEAADIWQRAADAYGKNVDGKNKNLINKAKALQSLGFYPEVCRTILNVLENSGLTCEQLISDKQTIPKKNIQEKFIKDIDIQKNSINKIIALRFLGEVLQRYGDLELSQTLVNKSLLASEEYPQEKGAVLLTLGNIERAIGNKNRDKLDNDIILKTIIKKDKEKIIEPYKQAFKYYEDIVKNQAPLITQIQAQLNRLSILIDIKEWWTEQIARSENRKWDELQEKLNNMVNELLPIIADNLGNLPSNRELVYAHIHFTHNLIRLKDKTSKNYFSQQEIAQFLYKAIKQAYSLGDKQAEAIALTNLAKFYESQVSNKKEASTEQNLKLLNQAKELTQKALNLYSDINIDNRQILYRQRHQLGRILKTQGKIKEALVSYAEAWNILQSLRGDLVTNVDNQFTFRQDVEPVYREFIDLLLNPKIIDEDVKQLILLNNTPGADNFSKSETPKNSPKSAIDIALLVMESLQLAELDNFFQEPCSLPSGKSVQLEEIAEDTNTAVIHPIILEDSLKVIISLSKSKGKKYNYPITIDKKEEEVKKTLEDFVNIIYKEAKEDSALNIHGTGDNKAELEKNEEEIKKLSTIVYSWLIKPFELKKYLNGIKTVVFVLDRPFQKIPIAALFDDEHKQYLIQKEYNIVVNMGQQLVKSKPLKAEKLNVLAAGVYEDGYVNQKRFNALNGVKAELKFIEEKSNNLGLSKKILRNKEFTKKNLQQEIKSSPNVVFLATHGVFSSNREQTFILTGEKKKNNKDNIVINIDDFQDLLNPQKIRNKNIELLVLSACQTAAGDEKAALGIAGVALRSGASSTVASLWSVSDTPTAKFMEKFFDNLTNRNKVMTRAEALRDAQRYLLKETDYSHPFYWAPFILVGNWL